WVGERHEQLEGLQSLKDEDLPAKSLWKPGKASRLFAEATILAPLDLNMLAGEGISQIEHTPQGARLRQQEPLPLTLYQNGIVMFDGPFRSYEEPSAQQCLQDIMDGYFPSELQMRYPDGIPFQVRSSGPSTFLTACGKGGAVRCLLRWMNDLTGHLRDPRDHPGFAFLAYRT
uniref:UBX domain-containing protein 11 n=1 Tax=Anser brachyrhynchus TaxID=132585 RepID=A0A8B9B9M2_9AVES